MGSSLRAILQTLRPGLPTSQPLTNSALRSDAERMREEEVVPCWSGSGSLPGLGILAQTQPVCAGLGQGHAPASLANQTETAATLGHANTPRVPDLYLPPIPWAVWLLPHLSARSACPTELPTKHTDAQSRRCWSLLFCPVTEVAAPSQVVVNQLRDGARPRTRAPG